jgi:exopolysaccharide production protein ExoQ
MSGGGDHPRSGVIALLASPGFARAYTHTVLGAVFGAVLIERIAGRVTLVTILAGLCAIGTGMLLARRRDIPLLRLAPLSLALFLAWALISLAWTTDQRLTLAGWLTSAGLALLAVVIGHVRDTLQTVRALGDVMRVLLSVSIGLEILSGILLDTPFRFLGIQGLLAEFGPIQGAFGTRNLLGFATVIALITFLVEYRTMSVRVGTAVFSVVLGGATAVFTDSPTVLVVAVVVALATGALVVVRNAPASRRTVLQWTVGALVFAGLVVGYVARERLLGLIGAGTDFSTRSDLWAAASDYVQVRPVQGWGWFGPWAAREVPFNVINFRLADTHASALNAYVDVVLQLGWAGLLLFLTLGAVALVRSWLVASERRSVVHAWVPLVLVALLVDSLFESFTLSGFGWFLLVVCAVRAGQSRSWRDRLRPADPVDGDAGLPRASERDTPSG